MSFHFESLTFEEQAAASAISHLNNPPHGQKRDFADATLDELVDFAADFAAGGSLSNMTPERPAKMARSESYVPATEPPAMAPAAAPLAQAPATTTTAAPVDASTENRELRPAPYYYYRDFSKEEDDDPLTPLTPPGRVPNFPAKMHAILSRADFRDIVAWLPHGRAWRILQPRVFEVKVIPLFFEHAKFSSFIRQANGWGFRRITQGRDRNAYYHEQFIRGLPHLCKNMKRPGVNQKKTADPDHEPDLYRISEDHPVPEKADDDSILLNNTFQNGPRARVPIYTGPVTTMMSGAPGSTHPGVVSEPAPAVAGMQVSPISEASKSIVHVPVAIPNFVALPAPTATTGTSGTDPQESSQRQTPAFGPFPVAFNMNAAAASQFAAGFAAATAFSQQHFQQLFKCMEQQAQQQQQQHQAM